MKSCHWFRSDLRIDDNTALRAAAEDAEQLHLVFLLDPALLSTTRQGAARRAFLEKSLEALAELLAEQGQVLHVEAGSAVEVMRRLQQQHGFDRVTWNRDYSPYAKARDAKVRSALEALGARVETFKDRVVFESDEILTLDGRPYSVYTPYRRAWERRLEETLESEPVLGELPPPVEATAAGEIRVEGAEAPPHGLPEAGPRAAEAMLESFLESRAGNYDEGRNEVAGDGSSRLSAHLRFGALSPRTCVRHALEAREAGGRSEGLQAWMQQIVWRDFYHAVLDANPHVIRRANKPEFSRLAWENDRELFDAWCEGRTGFPLVDAGMRELNATGFMHNRARMVVASFLTKDLLIDWRWGEKYFMHKLIDGDPANNNGGWQWAASTGTDAQPYFRIFNPVSQSKKFDADGEYIRRWVPELEGASTPAVHEPWKRPLETQDYPQPVVDHSERRNRALEMYKAAKAGM
ncbi:MAG: deoxyribodipyrimidine photo-lyase [Acidobacteriota bacterium]